MRVLALICMCCAVFFSEKKPAPYQYPTLSFFPSIPHNQQNRITEEGVLLGKTLFFDPVLSLDSSLSCGSCHRPEAAFSDAGNALSRGVGEAIGKRNSPGLFNLVWENHLFWDGRASSLEEQALEPVRNVHEMNTDWSEVEQRINNHSVYPRLFENVFPDQHIDSMLIAMALAQFERSLISYNSKYDSVLRGEAYFTKTELAGYNLANDQVNGGCVHCHNFDTNPLTTTGRFSNNGLDRLHNDKGLANHTQDIRHQGQFSIPSIRNLSFTAPYMHDGRFESLDEVLDFYSKGVQISESIDPNMTEAQKGGMHFSEEEKNQLKAFLHTLNDFEFVKKASALRGTNSSLPTAPRTRDR
ncbi:MAG: cytochrome-c peroxidase [Bacteroidia bacterium]